MKKLERYEYNCMGYVCTDEDVAELEASHAELLAALKLFIQYNEEEAPLSFPIDEMWAQARAAIAKAEWEGV